MSPPVFRFAPSPNGFLHLGHAYSALLNDRMARERKGRFLLRIENIDVTRCRPEFEAAIYDDLLWVGVRWETPVRRQSEHFADYAAALKRVGGLLYPCFCSRADIAAEVARRQRAEQPWPRDPDGAPLYPGTCKSLSRGAVTCRLAGNEPHALRLDLKRALETLAGPLTFERFAADGSKSEVVADPTQWGDVVLARKEVPSSYHLAVVIDDALQGVSHVVRGRDLERATDLHRVLQALLGLPVPHYHHHRLIIDDGGIKLAKSARSTSLRDLRESGTGAAEVRRLLGFEDAP